MTAQEILINYRVETEAKERELLHPKAALSANHSCYEPRENDHRLPYKRDVDRIVHSKAFARYADKTQVVYLVEHDHLAHRSLHVQLVSNFARGIAEILCLNLDLVEAIALGHDVGHPPYGHEGEGYLSELSEEYGNGLFNHPWQSCRLFREIEPLNLGLAVCDGFLCHDGGMQGIKFEPNFGKSWDDHFTELEQKRQDPSKNIMPGTLEGCLVKLCDTISYIGRDIEDAIILGILKREDIPHNLLGTTNREILSTVAQDIIRESYGKDYIAISQEVHEAIQQLRRFNFSEIYVHPKLKVESDRVKQGYRVLFELLIKDLRQKGTESYTWRHFIKGKTERYRQETAPVQMVVDYISGMTDKFFIRTLERLCVPKRIDWL